MAKKVAVVAVNPVNGMGLFQYLETFYEHKIPCTLFAVAETTQIKTNSGVALTADRVIADLKGHESEYDALVFACGDAVPVGTAKGRRVAVHPMARAAVQGPVATENATEVDGNFYTAQDEHAIPALIDRIVEALR